MKICIMEGDFTFKRDFGQTADGLECKPEANEAVYSALYLLTKVYSREDVKNAFGDVIDDL